jgi:hypothetical protein
MLSDQPPKRSSVWLSSLSDDVALIVKESPFLNVVYAHLSLTHAVLMPMVAKLTICGVFGQFVIKMLPQCEHKVVVSMPEPHTIDTVGRSRLMEKSLKNQLMPQ